MTGVRSVSTRVLLVAASTMASLVIAEAVLRLVDYHYTPLRIQVLRRSDWRPYHAFEDAHFVYDPVLIWQPKSGYSIFNAQGYRGRELELTKQPGEVRVFAFGDSNTLGWAGEGGPNWPRYLEDLLVRTHSHVTVVNAGVWGYTSFQGLRRFKEALRYQPDVALISFGSNDAHRVTISDAEFSNRRISRRNWDQMLHKARLGQFLLALADRSFSMDEERLVPRVSLDEYRANLEEIIRIGKEGGIRTVLLTRPFIGESPHPLWWKEFGPAYNAATAEVGLRTGVPVIDVYLHFKDMPEHFSDESHFTEAGNRLMAAFVYERIRHLLP